MMRFLFLSISSFFIRHFRLIPHSFLPTVVSILAKTEMVRRKHRALTDTEDKFSDSDRDSVDELVARRHARLEAEARGSESDSESDGLPEHAEREVLELDISDSDDDGPIKKPSVANIADSSDEGEESGDDEEEQDEDGDWGGRRHKYYGGDTQEHEIMEDEEREEVLAEEEVEAVRLQQKQLAELTADDYGVQEDAENDDSDDEAQDDDLPDSAPELGALANELEKYYSQLAMWGERSSWGEKARTRYHLCAAYTSNIAFYLALCTDPEASNVDNRSHEVLGRIVELRTLLAKHEKLLIAVPDDEPPSPVAVAQEGIDKTREKTNDVANEEASENVVGQKDKEEKIKKKERSSKKKKKSKEKEQKTKLAEQESMVDSGEKNLEALDDESFAEKLMPKKRKRKEKPAPVPHVYTFDDTADVNERRRASTQVALNRGLTRYRPREKKTPRTKNKLAYAKAVKKRKTMVREAVAVKPGVSYGGEASGINVRARNSARLSNF